ncbi:MAG: cyclic peptide export ABC transporter [Anaerolineae bacterium]|nr:cyclic peptide export ABC transporter [Caldilineales bacterium]MDW8269289.1 cyclic peptide export ABC transporter [Anaerolineae bacterium]
MKLFRLLWRTSPHGLLLAVVLGFIGGVAGAAEVALVTQGLTMSLPLPGGFFLRFVGLLVLVFVTTLLSKTLLIRLTEQAYLHLQLRLSRQILATPLPRLEAIGIPRLLAMLAQDNEQIAGFFYKVPLIMLHSAIILGSLGYMYWLAPGMATLLLLVMIPFVGGYVLLTRRAQRSLRMARRLSDVLFKHYEALTAGAKELRLHRGRRRAFYFRQFVPTAESHRQYRSRGRMIHEVANVWSQVLFFVFILLLFALSPRLGFLSHSASATVMTGFALVALYIRSSIAALVQAIPNYNMATVALATIESLHLPSDDAEAPMRRQTVETESDSHPAGAAWHSLALVNVAYAYREEDEETSFRLGPLSLVFQPGELVFIIGGNGSGKTTLAKLLCGLYPPEQGQILWDGRPVDEGNRDAFRQHFTAIFADFYLFEQMLGLDSLLHRRQAQDYLVRLHLDHKLHITESGFSTAKLSHGQRKRLALLTAYLEDRPIYIFDEWAAGQDPAFTEFFYRELLPELKRSGKLVIVISHDDRYFDLADRLIKLDYGQVEFDRPGRVAVGEPGTGAGSHPKTDSRALSVPDPTVLVGGDGAAEDETLPRPHPSSASW